MEKYNTKITIKDICIKNIDSVKTNQIGLIDYIDIASVDNESKIISSFKTIDIKDAPSRAKQLIKKNDILVSTVRPNLNAVAINGLISSNIQVCSTGFCVLRPKEYVLPSYLFNFCKSDLFINEISQQATGASYPAVNSKIIKNISHSSQHHRYLNIIIIIDSVGIPAEKTNIHIDQSIKSKY